jgi:hypothetical protein
MDDAKYQPAGLQVHHDAKATATKKEPYMTIVSCCVTLYKGHLSDLENRFTLILEIPCRTISVEPLFTV